MLKNDDNKAFDKFIRVILLALLGSLLSTVYLNKMHTEEMAYNKIQTSASEVSKKNIYKPSN